MSRYEITSFRGGISKHEDEGPKGSYKFGSNLEIRKDIDSLSCTQALIEDASGGTFLGLGLFTVPCKDGNVYHFCRDGRVVKRDSLGAYSPIYSEPHGAIKGAAEWYDQATGNTYLYWATDTRLNKKVIPGSNTWADVIEVASNLTSTDWHTMKEAVGNLMICNNDKLAMVGFDSSYTNEALKLIPSNIAKTLIERSIYVIIGTGRTDNQSLALLFPWDGDADSWNDKKSIPIASINAIIDTEIPIMQVGNKGQLVYADMQHVLAFNKFPGGGQVNPDGVANYNNLALFGVYGNGIGKTGIYSFGRKDDSGKFALTLEYQFDCDEIGSVYTIGDDIYFTYTATGGASWGIKKVNTAAKAIGTYESLDLHAPTGEAGSPLAEWNEVLLTMAALPAGCSVEVYRRMDKASDWSQCNMEGGGTLFDTAGGTEAVFLIGDKGRIFELKIVLHPTGNITPEIYKAEISLQ